MHPSPGFAWTDLEAMRKFIDERAFCTIFVEGPFLVHVPVIVTGPEHLRFHVFRANRAAAALDGAKALLSCLGADAYISPDWYGTDDQVPTWNYVAIEAEGSLRKLERHELIDLLDRLSAEHEGRLAPKTPWTKDKLRPDLFESALKAIDGYELAIEELRGTMKLAQHKKEEERFGLARGLDQAGRSDFASLVRDPATVLS